MTIATAWEAAFETVIAAHLLANGYVRIAPGGFDRERAIFRETTAMILEDSGPPVALTLVSSKSVQACRSCANGVC